MTKIISNGNNTFTKTSKISGDYQVWNIPSLDEGASIDEIPSAIAFKEGTTFSDGELLDIFKLVK